MRWVRALYLVRLPSGNHRFCSPDLAVLRGEIVPQIRKFFWISTCGSHCKVCARNFMILEAICSPAGLARLEPQRSPPCHHQICLRWRSTQRAPGRSLRIAHALAASARQVTRVPSDPMQSAAKPRLVHTRRRIVERSAHHASAQPGRRALAAAVAAAGCAPALQCRGRRHSPLGGAVSHCGRLPRYLADRQPVRYPRPRRCAASR